MGRSLKPYDLLWPVSRRQDVGMPGTEAKVVEVAEEERKNMMSIQRIPSGSFFFAFPPPFLC